MTQNSFNNLCSSDMVIDGDLGLNGSGNLNMKGHIAAPNEPVFGASNVNKIPNVVSGETWYDPIKFDTGGGGYDPQTGIWTCPLEAIYFIFVVLTLEQDSERTQQNTWLEVQSSTAQQGFSVTGAAPSAFGGVSTTTLQFLTNSEKGQKWRARVRCIGAAANSVSVSGQIDGKSRCYFGGWKVKQLLA